MAHTTTHAIVGPNTTVKAGDVDVEAETTTDVLSESSVMNEGSSGASIAVALNFVTTDTQASIGGHLTSTGDVTVKAELKVAAHITDADAEPGQALRRRPRRSVTS